MSDDSRISRVLSLTALLALCLSFACSTGDGGSDIENAAGLDAGGPLGKNDAVGEVGLRVDADYSRTEVWEVVNQWEDTDTPAAREAGIAWPANSGMTWDEKFGAWVQSLETIPGVTLPKTFAISTPWGKTVPAPKLDCADTALLMRASFAAWYQLPFYVVAFDHGEPVYFGHFGIRTKSGIWNHMPEFARFADDSDMPASEYQAQWPHDETLRKRGVQDGDDQPFLGDGARTGTYLDEIHLNKRAGRFIRLLLIFVGSMNLADSRNTYNLAPAVIRAGDVMLWRWQAQGEGHTMLTTRVDDIGGGHFQAQSAYGNIPPNQPQWTDATETRRNYTNPEGGGLDPGDGTDYAPFNGGLKRFRVAKAVNGRWTNTFMAADEASWINDQDHERMHRRPHELEVLLGQPTPEELRDTLLGVIADARSHLQDFPASCAARTKREKAFDDLYQVMADKFGKTKAEVDAEQRILDDYVFAELVYDESKTCCWDSSTHTMYETIMDLNNQLQAQATDMCVQPTVFKAVDGGYDVFKQHDPQGWVDWSADEACPPANVKDDTEASHDATPFCDWKDQSGSTPAPADNASCNGRCGSASADASCFCDDQCSSFGDCCTDYSQVCG